ncbi:FAD-binding protein [Pontibacter qinzhouensis]|uniref:FAD-binding protein n=1 Tax=Pontibacter qinzhouensis TaxID=2603253 RepID=A0A5C8K6G3_9BACT|nr:D-arabinono-1,4-lactone oxidase [Pontibacter qinzhouensis]TXK44848.1 FAD-binding protein [Pontibacter qinzhouensis]
MSNEWTNWSGSVRFSPEEIAAPASERGVVELVQQAIAQRKGIRIVGAGHSSVPLVQTNHVLVSQHKLKGAVGHDPASHRVNMLPGTSISEAGEELIKLKLSMHNTGDVDMQYLAGAFGTGTHGSGRTLQNLSSMLVGCKLVDGTGELRSFSLEEHPDIMRAAKVSLGALGFFTELTIQAEPAVLYARKEYCSHIDVSLEHLEELIDSNRMFDMYWYPRSDRTKLRTCNQLGEGMDDIPFAEKAEQSKGWLYEILPQFRDLKYEEMEYIIPLEAGPECFREIRKRIKEKHRQYVGWRVLYRTIAADDVYLSPFYNQESVTIAVLQNNELEYKKYFDDIEPIFRAYGGRPHWGKKHSLAARDFQELYPEWEKFLKIRQQFDPEGIFLNDYLKKIFGL